MVHTEMQCMFLFHIFSNAYTKCYNTETQAENDNVLAKQDALI